MATSLIEKFLREKRDAIIGTHADGRVQLVWRGDSGSFVTVTQLFADLDEYLADLLDVATDEWLADLGLKQHLGSLWSRGNVCIDRDRGRAAVRCSIIRQNALATKDEWRCVTPGVWVNDTPDTRQVYDGPNDRLTTTVTKANPTLQELGLCS